MVACAGSLMTDPWPLSPDDRAKMQTDLDLCEESIALYTGRRNVSRDDGMRAILAWQIDKLEKYADIYRKQLAA